MQANRLRPLPEGELPPDFYQSESIPPQQPPPVSARVESAATSMLFTSLRALSQRTLIAVANLFVLATAGSAFWLWLTVLPAPSVLQLVGLALYGVLILCLNWLVLRRK